SAFQPIVDQGTMTMRPVASVVLTPILICLAVDLHAQAPVRVGGPRPLILNNGSIGIVQALQFSPDSRFLYVAGLDKEIHTWNLLQIKPNEFFPTYVRSLRWETSRGQGKLDAMSLSPDGNLIAGGGTSARNNGEIGLWDTGSGRFATPGLLPLVWAE